MLLTGFVIGFNRLLAQDNGHVNLMAQLVAHSARSNALLCSNEHRSTAHFESFASPVNNGGVISGNGNRALPVAFNSLWLGSLVIAVIVASLATLVKQWLLYVSEKDSGRSSRTNFLLRQHRYNSLVDQWSVPFIIDMLPAFLRVAFLSFLVGLVTELSTIDVRLGTVAAVVVGVWVIVYVAIALLPLRRTNRAYKSPEALLVVNIYYALWYCISPYTLPFARPVLRWRSWKEIERADLMTLEKQAREEQDFKALMSTSTVLALSQETSARAIWSVTEDYTPDRAMKLVNSIAVQVSSRLSSARPTTDWEYIWSARLTREDDFKEIGPYGIDALLDIVVDRVLIPAGRDPDIAESGSILAALACFSTLLPYRLYSLNSLSVRLADPLFYLIQHFWSPLRESDDELATKCRLATDAFRIMCIIPTMFDHQSFGLSGGTVCPPPDTVLCMILTLIP